MRPEIFSELRTRIWLPSQSRCTRGNFAKSVVNISFGGRAGKENYDCAFGAKSRPVDPVAVEFNAAQRANMLDVIGSVAFGENRRLTNWHPLGTSGDDVPGCMECDAQFAFRQAFSISALFHPESHGI